MRLNEDWSNTVGKEDWRPFLTLYTPFNPNGPRFTMLSMRWKIFLKRRTSGIITQTLPYLYELLLQSEWKSDNKYLQGFKGKRICIQGSKCQSFGCYSNNAFPLFVLVHSVSVREIHDQHLSVLHLSWMSSYGHIMQYNVNFGTSHFTFLVNQFTTCLKKKMSVRISIFGHSTNAY